MNAALLQLKNVNAYYLNNNCVLKNINLHVAENEVIGILGVNGSGKTTLLNAICGIARVSGNIIFNEQEISNKNTENIVRQGIVYIPEGRGIFHDLTVEENLRLAIIMRSNKNKELLNRDKEIVRKYFPILIKRKDLRATLLSGGEQQMLAIARSLLLHPKLLLIDEPSLGLAPLAVNDVYQILQIINREYKIGMILVEQYSKKILELANRVYIFSLGEIQLERSRDSISRDELYQNYFN